MATVSRVPLTVRDFDHLAAQMRAIIVERYGTGGLDGQMMLLPDKEGNVVFKCVIHPPSNS